MTEERALSTAAARLAVIRAAARAPISLLPLIVVATNGASAATDCFFLVYSGIGFIVNSGGPLLEAAIVPFAAEARTTGSSDAFLIAVLRRVALFSLPVSGSLVVLALLARAAWSPHAGWEQAWVHVLVLAGLPFFSCLSFVMSGYLNAESWFTTTALAAGLRGGVALVVGLTLRGRLGPVGFSFGLLCGEVATLLWLANQDPVRIARRSRPTPTVDLTRFSAFFLSMIAGGFANSSRGFVDRAVAATTGTGAVSVIEFAERIFLMATSFVGAPFVTVALSRWSSAFPVPGEASARGLRPLVRKGQVAVGVLGLGILGIYPVLVSHPVGARLFAGFSPEVVHTVKFALILYLCGALPYLLNSLTTQAILVLRDARFVVVIAVAVGLANVPLDFLGVRYLGVAGIALASSLLNLISWLITEMRLHGHTRPLRLVGSPQHDAL